MGTYCTTQQILDWDPGAANLVASPDSPDFTTQIALVSEEIEAILRNTYPRITSSDLDDSTQLKVACIHGVLAMLYRSAVLHRGSSAQYLAEQHTKEFNAHLQRRIDLVNGQTATPGFGRVVRV